VLTVAGVVLMFIAGFRLAMLWQRGREPSGKAHVIGGNRASFGTRRNKHGLYSVHVAVDLPVDLSFSLYREGAFDRVAKACGIARELQTGDMPFDGRIYIQSEDPALHEALQLRKDLRNRLFHLMREPTTREVSAAGGRLWVVTKAYNDLDERNDDVIAPAVIADLLPDIRAVVTELARVRGSGMDSPSDHTHVVRRRISIVLTAGFVAAVAALVYTWLRQDHQLVLAAIPHVALLVTTAAAAAWFGVLYLALGATAFTHRVVLDVLLAGVPAVWVATIGGLIWCNETMETRAARRVPIPVERAWESKSRKSRSWHLATPGWPDPRAPREVRLTRDEFDLVSTQRCVDVIWHDGRLGDGWVEAYLPSKSLSCSEAVER